MLHWGLRFVILLLVLSFMACTEEEEKALEEFQKFFSGDHVLTLSVPRDLLAKDEQITITPVPLDQLPESLRQLRAAGTGYKIEPAGLSFSKPVKVVWSMKTGDLQWPSDGADAYGLAGATPSGERQLLTNLETGYRMGADSVTVSGQYTGGLDYIGRTRSSLSARVPAFEDLAVAGHAFKASFMWRNADTSGNVTLSDLSAQSEASGAVSLKSKATATSGDLAPGKEFTDQRDFDCHEAGKGAITMRLSATSVVKSMDSVPLRLTIEQPVDCAKEGATPSEPAVKLPQNLTDYFGLFSIKGADLLNVHYTEDATNDHIYADSSKKAGFTPAYTDATGFFRAALDLSQMAASRLDAAYGCGTFNNGVQTVCSQGAPAFPAGQAYLVGGTLREALPTVSDHVCIVAALFDSGNLFKPEAPYNWDFYLGTGTWYEAGNPGNGWSALTSRVSDQNVPRQPFASAARLFIVPDLKIFGALVSLDEIPGATGYRATVDCHDTQFSPEGSGGDVPGANPTEGLLPVPTTWIDVPDICGGRCVPPPKGTIIVL